MIQSIKKNGNSIVLSVSESNKINLSFSEVKEVLIGGSGEIYDGPYTVEPTFGKQMLETKNKTLYNDVTVNAIRVERVSNTHGTTVYIGTKGD